MRKRTAYQPIAWLFSLSLLLGAIAAPMLSNVAHAAGDEYTPYGQLTADDYWPGEIIVKFKDRPAGIEAFSASSFAPSAESEGMELEQVDALHEDTFLYRTHDDVLSTLAALMQDPRVEYAQPHFVYRLFTEPEPNDPYWTDLQWDMHQDNWGINLPDAWSYTQGSADVVVGVVDSGVDYYHEDLNADSGRVLVLPGSNFVVTPEKDGNTPMDGRNNGHGTHVAGTIAATANNGLGVAGIAPLARIMPVKVGPDDAEVLYFVEQGVQFAGDHGAKIVNLSLGGNGCGNSVLYELIRSHPDVLFVAAAGNDGFDLAKHPVFPAIFAADSNCSGTPYPGLPNVVTVGSVDKDGDLSAFSNYSDTYVNLAAPGYAIYSLLPRNESGASRYDKKNGTSMAAPHVSGAAALIYALAPDLTPAEVIDILERTVTTSIDLSGKVKTGGTLNAGAAVAYAATRAAPVTADRIGAVAAGTTVTLSTYTSGSDIIYTLDGSEPIFAGGVAVAGERYDEPIAIDAPVTIKARAYKDGMLRSETAEFTYSILSSSTVLSSLSVSSGVLNPAFGTGIETYTASVPHSIGSVTVTAATYDPNARIQINGEAPVPGFASVLVELGAEASDVAVKVTAEDGVATQTYNIQIVRDEGDSGGDGGDSGGNGGDGGGDPGGDSGSDVGRDDPGDSGGDGGNAGGGNGNGGPAGVTTPAPPAKLANDPAAIALNPELDLDTHVAKATLDQATWNNAVENAATDQHGLATVRLALPSVENAAAYELTLPQSALASAGADTRLAIATDFAVITLPGNMLVRSDRDPDAAISLSIVRLDASQIANDETRSLIGEHPIIRIDLKVGGEAYSWSNPLSPAEISIPYTPAQEEQAALEHLTVRYVDSTGETTAVPSGRYDPNTGAVSFTAAHFSDYAVAFVRKSFGDLEAVPWAQKPIEVLAAKGVVQGDGAHSFAPGRNVTRADFVLMLVRMLGLTAEDDGDGGLSGFDDVAPDAYYADAVHIARKLGIAAGSGDGRFHPADAISRQDMMVLTVRALRLSGEWDEADEAGYLEPFRDQDAVAAYALDSLSLLVRKGLVVGDGGELHPRHSSSRAEAAVLLYRIYNLVFHTQK